MKPGKITSYLPNQQNLFTWLNTLVMLAGLLFFHWRPVMIVFAYVFETIIIGVIHICKLLAVYKFGRAQREAPLSKDPRSMNGFGIVPFFIVHYFFFIFVQSVFIFSFIGNSVPGMGNDAFDVLANYRFLLAQPDMLMAFACICAANIAYAVKNFFAPQRYHAFTLSQLFLQPYIRIFVQQFVSIASGFFFMLFADGAMAVALVLILTRLWMDLYLSAIANNQSMKRALIKKLTKDGKNNADRITEKQIDLFLE